jgi:ankyrin repeat protein
MHQSTFKLQRALSLRLKRWACLLALILATALPAFAADSSAELLQKGLFEEEANHNLDSAIKVYQAVVQQTDEQRKIGAMALFRLGECYRKLGQTNNAVVYYQRVLREFPEQNELVKSSRRLITELGVEPEIQTAASMGAKNAEAEELAQIQKIFRESPDLTQTQTQIRLEQAATNGWVQVVEFLLANHTDVNVRQYGGTTLHSAVGSGHNEVVKLLLSRGTDVNATDFRGYTGLHVAVENGYQAVVETLVSAQANVNAATQDGWTALHFAALKGHRVIAETLIQHKADLNVRSTVDVRGNLPTGMTPLCVAAMVNSPAVAELLCRAGAQVDIASEYGRTPLHYAANSGASEVIKTLLEHKANGNLQDHLGWTPLHMIVYRLAAGDESRMQAGGLQRGISPELLTSLNLLLAHKAKVNIRNNQEFAPLNFFGVPAKPTISGQEQAIALLKEHGALDDVPDLAPDANVVRVWHKGFGKNHALWTNSSNHQNRFTLLETIWSYYLDYPVLPGDKVLPRAYRQVPSHPGLPPETDRFAGPLPECAFYLTAARVRPAVSKAFNKHVPDLSRITVHRLLADKTYRKIEVNLLNGAAIDCSKDMDLAFGDVIAIPEKETGEEAPAIGQQGALQLQMKACATRRVKLITRGKTNEFILNPGAGRYLSQALYTIEMRVVLITTGNSEASQFRITRLNKETGKPEEMILDRDPFIDPSKSLSEDILLIEGDIIEVIGVSPSLKFKRPSPAFPPPSPVIPRSGFDGRPRTL